MPIIDRRAGPMYTIDEVKTLIGALKEIVPANWLVNKGTFVTIYTPGYDYYITFLIPSNMRSVVPGRRVRGAHINSSDIQWHTVAEIPLAELPTILNDKHTELQKICIKARLQAGV